MVSGRCGAVQRVQGSRGGFKSGLGRARAGPAASGCARTVVRCASGAGRLAGRSVAVTGATGFVGGAVVDGLLAEGAERVTVLPSGAQAASRASERWAGRPEVTVAGPGADGWAAGMDGCDGCVNLAGAPIAESRWSDSYKALIRSSRVEATRTVVGAMKAQKAPAGGGRKKPVLVSASALGAYGTSESATFDERSNFGEDFLAEVCRDWEAEAMKAEPEARVVVLRLGIVLEGEGGALGKMLPAFRFFLGGPLGDGKQWFTWIHRKDVVRLVVQALADDKYRGVYNATAPEPVRMGEVCDALGGILSRPNWAPVPPFVLTMLLGDGAKVVLEGQRVLPTRTHEAGFKFDFPDVKSALRDIVA